MSTKIHFPPIMHSMILISLDFLIIPAWENILEKLAFWRRRKGWVCTNRSSRVLRTMRYSNWPVDLWHRGSREKELLHLSWQKIKIWGYHQSKHNKKTNKKIHRLLRGLRLATKREKSRLTTSDCQLQLNISRHCDSYQYRAAIFFIIFNG